MNNRLLPAWIVLLLLTGGVAGYYIRKSNQQDRVIHDTELKIESLQEMIHDLKVELNDTRAIAHDKGELLDQTQEDLEHAHKVCQKTQKELDKAKESVTTYENIFKENRIIMLGPK